MCASHNHETQPKLCLVTGDSVGGSRNIQGVSPLLLSLSPQPQTDSEKQFVLKPLILVAVNSSLFDDF